MTGGVRGENCGANGVDTCSGVDMTRGENCGAGASGVFVTGEEKSDRL